MNEPGTGGSGEGYPGHATFYVSVDDPAETLDQIEARGGKTVLPVTEIPNGPTIALFAGRAASSSSSTCSSTSWGCGSTAWS